MSKGKWFDTKYSVTVLPSIPFIAMATFAGRTQEDIAHSLGIGTSTFKRYLKEHPSIPRCTKRGRKTGICWLGKFGVGAICERT